MNFALPQESACESENMIHDVDNVNKYRKFLRNPLGAQLHSTLKTIIHQRHIKLELNMIQYSWMV